MFVGLCGVVLFVRLRMVGVWFYDCVDCELVWTQLLVGGLFVWFDELVVVTGVGLFGLLSGSCILLGCLFVVGVQVW